MEINLSVEDGDWSVFIETRTKLEVMLQDAIELAKKHKEFGIQAIIASAKEGLDNLYIFGYPKMESEVKK